jgi:hypothetical protein
VLDRCRPARRRPWRAASLLLAAAFVLMACGGERTQVTWRNVTLPIPEGWFVFEEEPTRLSLSNADIGPDADGQQPDEPVVAMHFTYEPRTQPGDVREHLAAQDAEIETDRQILLGDDEIPATQFVYSYETGGTPTREMVVVIASRAIVLLAIPVPLPGDTDAPEVFLEHLETFLDVLDQAEFGSPVLD